MATECRLIENQQNHLHKIIYRPDLFRYQLLPASQYQQNLFEHQISADEIREKKNIFFDKILGNLPPFRHRKGLEIIYKLINHTDSCFVFKIGAHKSIDRDTQDFRKEKIENWPNLIVIINNAPDIQVIAISKNIRAFSSSSAVAKLLERTFSAPLRAHGLTIQIKEQFEEKEFWSLIKKHEGKIDRVRFEMVAPNMANISQTLKVDLKQLNRESNCQKTNLELQALTGASLELNDQNELINGCVEYSALGGGDIAIKIKGIKKEFRTSTTVKSIEIDEIFLPPGSDLHGVLNQLFQNDPLA